MKTFAISDLHLSFGTNKPMDIFGDNWANYEQKITQLYKNRPMVQQTKSMNMRV
jgi:predicted phosphohydrolase